MPTAAVCATLCTALLATPLLALAQSAILPQQRDAAGNVMEPLGQVLIASETGPSGLMTARGTATGACACSRLPRRVTGRPCWKCLRRHRARASRTPTTSASTCRRKRAVAVAMDRAAGPWRGSDEPVTDPQQRARQNVLVGGIVKFSTMYSGGGADASTLQLARVRHLQDDIQVDDDVLTVPWLGNAMIRACSASRTSSSAPVPATTNTGSRRSWRWIRLPRACQCCATRPWRPGTRPVFALRGFAGQGAAEEAGSAHRTGPGVYLHPAVPLRGGDVPPGPGTAGLCRLYRTLNCSVERCSTGLRMGGAKSQSSMARPYKSGGGAYSQRVDVMMLSLSTNTRRRSWRMSLVVMVLGPIGLTRPAPLSRDRRRMLGSLAGWPIAQPSWLASQRPLP